jgi:hypothetical protein
MPRWERCVVPTGAVVVDTWVMHRPFRGQDVSGRLRVQLHSRVAGLIL